MDFLETYLNNAAHLESFTRKLSWSFDHSDPEGSIKSLKREI